MHAELCSTPPQVPRRVPMALASPRMEGVGWKRKEEKAQFPVPCPWTPHIAQTTLGQLSANFAAPLTPKRQKSQQELLTQGLNKNYYEC